MARSFSVPYVIELEHVVAEKVLIYAQSGRGLLVFEEPDFPKIPLQVPGGTVEPGETPIDAAIREFTEETGLCEYLEMTLISRYQYRFERDGVAYQHNRHCYKTTIPDDQTIENWIHFENDSSESAKPIRFQFSWISLDDANLKLGFGMNRCLSMLGRELM